MHVSAIIVAAGVGARMGGAINKHLLPLGDKPLLAHTLKAFEDCPIINNVILVGGIERLHLYRSLVEKHGFTKVRAIVPGGETRQDSCARGLEEVSDTDIVVVHDGARPLVSVHLITEVVQQAKEHGAAIAAVPVKDTIKLSTDGGFVAETLPRDRLWQAQTPQAFRTDLLRQAQQAASSLFIGTDDAVLVERLGLPVKIVQGDYSNIKITTADDLIVAEYFLQQRRKGVAL